MTRSKLPIGIQTFREVREDNCYYVDKTAYIRRLLDEGKHFFLSRPRRFGKSLFLDTCKELFEGNEPLFEGLYIHDRWDWSVRHPALRLDFSSGTYQGPDDLREEVAAQLNALEEEAEIIPRDDDTGPARFRRLMKVLHERTGQRVAVLIDEYDKPMLDALEVPDIARANRDFLRGLYSTVKFADAHIRSHVPRVQALEPPEDQTERRKSMSRKFCVFTWGAILLLCALLDNMQATGTAWAQPAYGFQRGRQFMSAGEVFRDCARCPEMVVLPAGIFMMGHEDMRSEYHSVTIAEPLAVGRYEVTFAEWDACVAEGGCNGYQPEDNNWGRGHRPAINVSWEDAQDYLYWLGRKTGESYHLLSEAEWEYAVRAGTTTDYYWGDGISASNEICTYAKVSGQRFACAEGEPDMTVPVGSFRPNPFGLYDMIGNVQEWTADCWNDTYYRAPADGRAWQQGDCTLRVIRGGSYHREDDSHDSASRLSASSSERKGFIGFRVARAAPAVKRESRDDFHRDPVQGLERGRFKSVGDVFSDCARCPEMVVLPGGSFLMGSPPYTRYASDSQQPYHPVTIAEPFAVGRYEVTFDEWDACVAEGGCNGYEPEDEKWGRGNRPVINVNWDNAHDYLNWLSQKTGKSYRLLSEAEWEYAVRAGTTTDNYWGDYKGGRERNAICAYANVSESAFDCYGKETTMPVGSFPPNPFGLYDMIGNVQELTADCWNDTYEGAPADGRAWQQGDCRLRITRGGSFSWNSSHSRSGFRSAARNTTFRRARYNDLGFRVAREMTVPRNPARIPLE